MENKASQSFASVTYTGDTDNNNNNKNNNNINNKPLFQHDNS